MTKQEFFQQFVLLAMTNNIHEQYFSPSDALRRASEVWDVIESNTTRTPALIVENPTDIKALAQDAIRKSHGAAKWLTIDADGKVNAFDTKPSVDQHFNDRWCPSDLYWDTGWLIANVQPPADFTQECYEIAVIIGTKN